MTVRTRRGGLWENPMHRISPTAPPPGSVGQSRGCLTFRETPPPCGCQGELLCFDRTTQKPSKDDNNHDFYLFNRCFDQFISLFKPFFKCSFPFNTGAGCHFFSASPKRRSRSIRSIFDVKLNFNRQKLKSRLWQSASPRWVPCPESFVAWILERHFFKVFKVKKTK